MTDRAEQMREAAAKVLDDALKDLGDGTYIYILRQVLAGYSASIRALPLPPQPPLADDWKARAENAEAEVERLRGALEWYADETNYDMHFVPRECGCCTDDDIPTELDRGERARTALTPKGADHD